jgi:hypothetical protein
LSSSKSSSASSNRSGTPHKKRTWEEKRHKQKASKQLHAIMQKKHYTPPTKLPDYQGKTLKEHAEFTHNAYQAFDVHGNRWNPDKKAKVAWAVQSLKGEPSNTWEQDPQSKSLDCSFEEFLEFLKDLVQDPVNRQLSKVIKYETARQGDTQLVNSFVAHLTQLEQYLPPYSSEHLCQHLFVKLHPGLQREILKNSAIPTAS